MKYVFQLVFTIVSALALAGCNIPESSKAEEKRILAEIEEHSERSRSRLGSEEMRATMIRLNELRLGFPDKREDIEKEAERVKVFLVQAFEDDVKLTELLNKLNALPLSNSYEQCVSTQIKLQDYSIKRLKSTIEEIDVLTDPSVNDLATFDSRVETIRTNSKQYEVSQSELETFLDENCKRPVPNKLK